MNIAVFLDEVMPINGPLLLIPGSHKQGVFEAGHDKLTTSYPLWTLDKDTVTRLCRDAEAAHGARHRGADRQARLGADVPRQPGARLAAQHHALSAQDRLRDVLRLLQPHHQVHPRRNGSRTATSRRSSRSATTRCWNTPAPTASRRNDFPTDSIGRIRATLRKSTFLHSHVAAHAFILFTRSSWPGLAIAALCSFIAEVGCRIRGEAHVHALFDAPLGQLLQGAARACAARHPLRARRDRHPARAKRARPNSSR